MSAKALFVFCAQALFIQLALGQCLNYAPRIASCGSQGIALPSLAAPCGGLAGNGLAYGARLGYGSGASAIEVTPTTGGALPVSSSSSVAPSGLSVSSENVFEGSLQVIGELPFLSAIALEGVLPSAGAGVVNYGCGNGVTAITSGGVGSGYGIGGLGGVNAYGPAAISGIGGYGGLAGIGSGVGCGANYGIRAPCGCGY